MKSNPKSLTVCVLLLVAFFLPVTAQPLEIAGFENIENQKFYYGDHVDVRTVLVNNGSTPVSLSVEQYVTNPVTDPIPINEIFTIDADNYTIISDLSFDVSEYSKTGTYTHVVKVYDDNNIVGQKITTFYIEGLKESLNYYQIAVCSDDKCKDVTSIFDISDKIYIKAESREQAGVTGYITLPDGNTQNLFFADGMAEFEPRINGTHELSVIFFNDNSDTEKIESKITVTGEMTGESLTGEVSQNPLVWLLVGFAAAVVIAVIAALLRRNKCK